MDTVRFKAGQVKKWGEKRERCRGTEEKKCGVDFYQNTLCICMCSTNNKNPQTDS